MRSTTYLFALSLSAASAVTVWVGCSDNGEAATGDEANITETECEVVSMATGRKMSAADLAQLNDPIAKFVIGGKNCPKTFKDITTKLDATDTGANCSAPAAGGVTTKTTLFPLGGGTTSGVITGTGGGGTSGGFIGSSGGGTSGGFFGGDGGGGGGPSRFGISTRFISETSQVLGTPDSYRAVYRRACGTRSDHELFISAFGIQAGTNDLPTEVEMIGEDATAGVFNFYAREQNQWRFFGNSKDFVSAGYNCENGKCQSKLAGGAQRCAGCHTGGGLVMKELQSPWVHWEGTINTPGTDDLMKRFPQFGEHGNGADLEPSVETANTSDWIPKRLAILKDKGAEEVLRPLFCTMDVNLQSAGTSASLGGVPSDFFLDPAWQNFDFLQMNDNDYQAVLKTNGQHMLDLQRQPLSNKKGPVLDNVFALTYPSRVSPGMDASYNAALAGAGIVDDDFVKDVLSIDFTRPIFSTDRCALLSAAPNLTGAQITPAALKDGFIKNLTGKTGAAAQLLANLKNTSDAAQHVTDVTAFMTACKARPQKDLLTDVVTIASHRRNEWRKLAIAEFAPTMPFDKVADADKALDPVTCTLK